MITQETTLKRPKRYNAKQLALAGVELLNPHLCHLRCMNCGKGWSPNLLSGGRLPRGYWKCPNGCNEEAEDTRRKLELPWKEFNRD